MPRKHKKKSSSVSDELPENELSLSSLYAMIVELQNAQKTFQVKVYEMVTDCLTIIKDTTSDWSTYIENTWSNISNGLIRFGGKLDYLDKKFKEMNSTNSSTVSAYKVVVKGIPENIDDESLQNYVSTMFASLDEDIKDFTTERIGTNGLVKVFLKTEEEVNRILRRKHTLKESEEFKTLFVNPWLSGEQRRTDFNIRQLVKVSPKVKFSGGRVYLKT